MKRSTALIILPLLGASLSANAANLENRIDKIESNLSRYEQNLDETLKKLKASNSSKERKKYQTQADNRQERIQRAEKRLANLQNKASKSTDVAKDEQSQAVSNSKSIDPKLEAKIQKIESNIQGYEANMNKDLKKLQASKNTREIKKLEKKIEERRARIEKAQKRIAKLLGDDNVQAKNDPAPVTASQNLNEVVLSWQPSADSVIGYYIYAGNTENKTEQLLADLTRFDGNAPSFDIDLQRDVPIEDKVCFRIKAYSNTTVSDFSDAVCTSVSS